METEMLEWIPGSNHWGSSLNNSGFLILIFYKLWLRFSNFLISTIEDKRWATIESVEFAGLLSYEKA